MAFPQAVRLKTRSDFKRVVREGKRLVGRFFCADCRQAASPKLGISASTRFGSAPERNRFKRLMREAFRKNYANLPPVELNAIPRVAAKTAKLVDIENELMRLLQ